jgi:hypothetical protein
VARALLAAVLVACAPAAQAELYRWIDPESGSVKYSTLPPPWFGNEQAARGKPPVEVIKSGPAEDKPKAGAPRADAAEVRALEARRKALLETLFALAERSDAQAKAELAAQIRALEAVARELERLDPEGEPRRRAEGAALAEKLRAAARTAPARIAP